MSSHTGIDQLCFYMCVCEVIVDLNIPPASGILIGTYLYEC